MSTSTTPHEFFAKLSAKLDHITDEVDAKMEQREKQRREAREAERAKIAAELDKAQRLRNKIIDYDIENSVLDDTVSENYPKQGSAKISTQHIYEEEENLF